MFENINFDTVCKEKLSASINAGTFPHAVILEGADSDIRLKTALKIAEALVCIGENKPCGVCSSCKKVKSGNHPDVYLFQKEDSATAIKVDDVRSIREKAMLMPNDGEKTIFIISEAQFMNPQAQNALLKIFEEPAKHVTIILTCPSRTAMLETITSRASAFLLSQEEGINSTSEKDSVAFECAQKLLQTFCLSNEFEFLKETSAFTKDKDLFKAVLPCLIYIFRDALVKTDSLSNSGEIAQKLSAAFTPKKLINLIEETKKLIEATERAANYNLTITRLSSVFYRIKNS